MVFIVWQLQPSKPLDQGIEDIKERVLGKKFCYANNGKNFKELFTPTSLFK